MSFFLNKLKKPTNTDCFVFYFTKLTSLLNNTSSGNIKLATTSIIRLQSTESLELELPQNVSVDKDEHVFKMAEISNYSAERYQSPFKFGELVTCRVMTERVSKRNKQMPKINNRMFLLEPHGVFRTRAIEIFHEHILNMQFFNFKSIRVDFKRPSLYEYVTFKEQQAVSSHYSILTLVPLMLELERGSRVLECGTGSGSMTLFLSRHLGNTGILHTFDLTEKKQQSAKKYFQEWKQAYDLRSDLDKWPENVKFGCLNFAKDQTLETHLSDFYDAIYLDMANEHVCLHKVYKLLRPGGVLVINAMQMTQIQKCLNVIDAKGIGLENEMVIEPCNRFWEIRKIKKKVSAEKSDDVEDLYMENSLNLNWTLRLEDRFAERFKRGGLFFNYWQGFLAKFKKIK